MLKFLTDPTQRGWAFMAIVGVLVVLLLGPFVFHADERHLTAFSEGERDAALARVAIGSRVADVEAYLSTTHQLADIESPEKTVLVVLGPERRYSEGETQAILDFVREGGRLILADDAQGGYGTDIAREIGFGFVEEVVLDTRNHLGDPTLVTATFKVDTDYRVLFNAPTALRPLSNVGEHEVLAESSRAVYPDGSYLDTNGNGEIDISDAAGPFPLAVRAPYGAGVIVLIADTGLFMDAQVELIGDFENDPMLQALTASLVPRDGTAIFDESRHAPAPLVAAYDNGVRTLGRLTAGLVAPAITLLLVALATLAAWRLTRETEDWSHHAHDLGQDVPVPESVRPDLDRAQRMARRRISERFNIPVEQVAAMPADQLLSLTGDRMLAEAAAGTLRSDPAPLFKSFSQPPEATR